MSKKLFQLVGVDGDNIGLYEVPKKIKNWDIQGLFKHAFETIEARHGDEFDLDDLDQYLRENHKIERTFTEVITTEKF